MDNTIVDPNKEVIFHPVDSNRQAIDDRQKVAEHVSMHYRKYLFGIGTLCGFTISLMAWIFFGTSTTSSTTQAAYETLTPEVNAILIFNQMDAIAHEKDNYFHQTGKIYSLSGDTLFHKYDTMYHVLDNTYHRTINIEEKLKRAQRLESFLKVQNDLFAATAYANSEQDRNFAELDKQFLKLIDQINNTGNNQSLTGTNEGITWGNKILTGEKIAQ